MKTFKVEKQYKDLMENWIEDLKINPELQGEECLYDNSNYCCLGRLCIVAGYKDDDILDLVEIEAGFDAIPKTFMGSNPSILIHMNDGEYIHPENRVDWGLAAERRQYTFPEIAEFLEKHIEYV